MKTIKITPLIFIPLSINDTWCGLYMLITVTKRTSKMRILGHINEKTTVILI